MKAAVTTPSPMMKEEKSRSVLNGNGDAPKATEAPKPAEAAVAAVAAPAAAA
jgi:small subunit ribosomal protein S6